MTLSNKEIKEITEKLQDIAYVLLETNRTYSADRLQEVIDHLEAHLEEA